MRTVLPLTYDDLYELAVLVPETVVVLNAAKVEERGLDAMGDAFTGRWDGAMLGCGGLVTAWPGVAIGWLILTPRAKKHPQATYRAIRSFLVDRVSKDRLWRIEASVHTYNPLAVKLAEVLGFEREGLRRKFLPDGADAWLYAWIKEN